MTGKIVICSLLTVLLFTISPASAQQPKKVPRIGYLSVSDAATAATGDAGEFDLLCARLAT